VRRSLLALQEAGDASPIVQWTGGKDFARGTNFSCMATSGSGHVVVGSKDGKIRFYSNKTLTQVLNPAEPPHPPGSAVLLAVTHA
jgi:hypothetical protein